MRPKTALTIVFVFLVVVFLVQNRETMNLHFLFWDFRMSASLVLLVSVLVSSLMGYIYGRVDDDLRERRKKEKLQKKVAALETKE